MRKAEIVYFAGGCFWGVEHFFLQVKGVLETQVGYMAGAVEQPSYDQVKTSQTGHLEVVKVSYDVAEVEFEELAKLFFEIHDPTQLDGQGFDIGSQYLSAILYDNEQQLEVANSLRDDLITRGYGIVTQFINANKETFWPAEHYHQRYFQRHPHLQVCHQRVKRF